MWIFSLVLYNPWIFIVVLLLWSNFEDTKSEIKTVNFIY
jgi:hypothetical protein